MPFKGQNQQDYNIYKFTSYDQQNKNNIIQQLKQICYTANEQSVQYFLCIDDKQLYILSYTSDYNVQQDFKRYILHKIQINNEDQKFDFCNLQTMKILLQGLKKVQNQQILYFNKLKSRTYLSRIVQSLINSLLIICQTYNVKTLNLIGNTFNDLRALESEYLKHTEIENLLLDDNDITSIKGIQKLEETQSNIKYISLYQNPICQTDEYYKRSLTLETKLVPNSSQFEDQGNQKNIDNVLSNIQWDIENKQQLNLNNLEVEPLFQRRSDKKFRQLTYQQFDTQYGVDQLKNDIQKLISFKKGQLRKINSKTTSLVKYQQLSLQYVYQCKDFKIVRYVEVEVAISSFSLADIKKNIIYNLIVILD